jgi:hypothetical protein
MVHTTTLSEERIGEINTAFARYIQENCTKTQSHYCNCDLKSVCKNGGEITDYLTAEEMLISAGFLTELPE